MATTYKDSGVDLDVYAESMRRLPKWMQRTFSPRVIPAAGGFAGLFQLDFDGKLFRRDYKNPVLVAGTDGVGTKLCIAQASDRHDTVGIDLVAMCVNDLLCTGAEPLFFLDYVAMGRDDPARLEKIVQGISDGCVQGDVALLGGETAIMPGLYGHADYDLAGFAVGVVERDKRIDGSAIRPGDQLIGIASSGIHSNGFSLVRKIVADNNLGWDAKVDALGDTTLGDTTLGEALLEPTRIYTGALRTIARHYKVKTVLRGIAHITGGGFGENIDRILPAGTSAIIHGGSWTIPPVFAWLQDQGKVPREEMYRVFNMGIGMVFVVGEFYADRVVRMLEDANFPSFRIGEIVVGDGRVSVQH